MIYKVFFKHLEKTSYFWKNNKQTEKLKEIKGKLINIYRKLIFLKLKTKYFHDFLSKDLVFEIF